MTQNETNELAGLVMTGSGLQTAAVHRWRHILLTVSPTDSGQQAITLRRVYKSINRAKRANRGNMAWNFNSDRIAVKQADDCITEQIK